MKNAEHMRQTVEPPISFYDAIGKPISSTAKQAGYSECKAMGLDTARAYECVSAVVEQLQRDQMYEAQDVGMRYLDLCGTYRLIAVLLATPDAKTKTRARTRAKAKEGVSA